MTKTAPALPVAVTPALRRLIDPTDPADPIARQFLPDPREAMVAPEDVADPIGDHRHAPVKGIIHRYPDRVLLTPVMVCAAYCRFCFRREDVGAKDAALTKADLTAALAYIGTHPEIWEVILSGGDPLVLSPRRLAALTAALAEIDHVGILRIHTRLPVAAPEKITPALVRALKGGKTAYVVLHANHPRELTREVQAACARLIDAGIPMLSQTVLLKGINDSPETLTHLLRTLVQARIKPYYLHHPDLAPGTSHFRPTLAQGQALMREIRGTVSGLCQPQYVLDIPGGHGKVPVGPCYVEWTGDDGAVVTDPWGSRHRYP